MGKSALFCLFCGYRNAFFHIYISIFLTFQKGNLLLALEQTESRDSGESFRENDFGGLGSLTGNQFRTSQY